MAEVYGLRFVFAALLFGAYVFPAACSVYLHVRPTVFATFRCKCAVIPALDFFAADVPHLSVIFLRGEDYMSDEMVPVSLEDDFSFVCGPDVSCFNQCCRDLNQFLTPYDVLRLKISVGMNSHEFLKKYTLRHNGPESGLPVVTFKMDPSNGYACPFVSDKGCTVYIDRPASCRMYPLARAVARSRETGVVTEYFALIEEPHCCGFDRKSGQAVGDWIAGQDVAVHNGMNDKLLEVIGLKNRLMPGVLDGADGDLFYLACYDLDTFRDQIKGGLLADAGIPEDVMTAAMSDDTALLDLGMEWVKFQLFGVAMSHAV